MSLRAYVTEWTSDKEWRVFLAQSQEEAENAELADEWSALPCAGAWDNAKDAREHARIINGALRWHPDTEYILRSRLV